MTAISGIIQEVRKTTWCVSVKIKVGTTMYIVKLSITNYYLKTGDTLHWFERKPNTFFWTPKGADGVRAELYQWGHGSRHE